jgi:SPP1 gp7 family putative phage head morphogenesis protein
MTRGAARIKRRLERLFAEWLPAVQAGLRRMHKAGGLDEMTLDEILAAIQSGDPATLVGDMVELLIPIAQDGGTTALAQVGITSDESIVAQVHRKAVDYARDRAASMVGMRWSGDELVENPNADYRIDESTRELLRQDVTAALEQGFSNDALAERLADSYAFSDERAEMIARTETAFADVAGNMIAYRESGEVDQKQWVTGDGCCDECKELDGIAVAIDSDFPNGAGDAPPLHPNCRCDVVPLIRDLSEPSTED